MSYGARRYAIDRASGDRGAQVAGAIAAVRKDIEDRGLGPATTAIRPSDRRTLVLDAKGWVHAVVWSAYDARLRVYFAVSRDLRRDEWVPGSCPWAPRAPRDEWWVDEVA